MVAMTEAIGPWAARSERKRSLYLDDPYYWEGLAAFRDGLAACPRADRSADETLSSVTFLLVKPESIAGGRSGQILDFVQAAGFQVTGIWPIRMGRHEARNLWRYSLNSVPIAHIRALEMLVSAGPLFLLGLRLGPVPGQSAGGPSAAERLNEVKGTSSSPGTPGTLRHQLGCPALMLNFVHTPDEPADVLRELSVLCEAGLLGRVVRELIAATGWSPARFDAKAREAAATLATQSAQSPSHDLDTQASLKRLRDHPGLALPETAKQAIRSGRVSPVQALDVVRSLELAAELPRWDRIVAAAHLVDGLRTGRAPLARLRRADERE
jgi:nucleoside diphosphate kinase